MTALNMLGDGTTKLIEDGYTLPLINRIKELEAENARLRIGKAAIKARTTRMLKALTTRFNTAGREREWWYQSAMDWSRRAYTAEATIQRVRDLHKRAHAVFSWQSGIRYYDPCQDCDGAPGVHECGCWADQQIEYVCAECHRLGATSYGIYDYTWPCPTIQALGDPK